MPDYVAIEDVDDWLPGGATLDDQSQPPTRETVEDKWIPSTTAQINTALKAASVELPLTDPDQLGKLRLMAARELAYQVMAVRAAASDTKPEPFYVGWHKDWDLLLEALALGADVAAIVTEGGEPWSTHMNATDDPTDPLRPYIRKDGVY